MSCLTILAIVLLATLCTSAVSAVEWKPVEGQLTTRWAKDVDPNGPLPEYPRPQLVRPDWRSLNGVWEYKPSAEGDAAPVGKTLSGRILVPFAVESTLSGIGKHTERCWYRRTFSIPPGWKGKRILLHFGAVDWETTVTINGRKIGTHRGGYDGFEYDITPALKPQGPQEIIVGVYDPTDRGGQPRGKQTLLPRDIWFTSVTGIWQSVWLEPVPFTRIESLQTTPDVDAGALKVKAVTANVRPGDRVRAVAMDGAEVVGEATGSAGENLTVPVPNAKLWSPDRPFLYTLRVSLIRNGKRADVVDSYFGMRKIEILKDGKGVPRIALNGKIVFQVGPLDQGYWPDGLYTAPTDAALKYDIEATKRLGFNMTRKHIKVEPERWYYWCDKLGLPVWQDMPNGEPRTAGQKRQFERELQRMIEGRGNHPCIVMWVVFNEGWGQYDTERLTARVKSLDASRLVINASGWVDKGVGDVVDMHIYPGPGAPKVEDKRAAVCGEFGGIWCYTPGHMWTRPGYEYRPGRTFDEVDKEYTAIMKKVYALRDDAGLAAAVYCEITDVEVEQAGLLTYDRAECKVNWEHAAAANRG